MASWSSFKAFGGTMDATFIKPRLNERQEVDHAATATSFRQWLQALRHKPAEHGIPSDKIEDAVNVLDAFFPDTGSETPIYPRRILSENGASGSLRKITPLQLSTGSSTSPVLIADAGSALGYVFSI